MHYGKIKKKDNARFPYNLTIYFSLLFKAIFFFTHKGNDKPYLFRDFCETYLPDHHVEQITRKQHNNKRIVLVMMVPPEERLKPVEHFSPEITKAVKLYGLEGRVYLQKKTNW